MEDWLLFDKLVNRIEQTCMKRIGLDKSIGSYTGREVELWLDDLQETTGFVLSKRWFYDHIKDKKYLEKKKIPRLDTIDILCKYIGEKNWESFSAACKEPKKETRKKKQYLIWLLPLITGLMVLSFYIFNNKEESNICFIDIYTQKNIEKHLYTIQSNKASILDSSGCLRLKNKGSYEIQSPYYINKKFEVNKKTDSIYLRPDDYALMIDYYAHHKIEDYQNRKKQLHNIFTQDAVIFEVSRRSSRAIGLYEKEEFIRKLITPTRQLERIEILEIVYRKDKISKLKFWLNPEK